MVCSYKSSASSREPVETGFKYKISLSAYCLCRALLKIVETIVFPTLVFAPQTWRVFGPLHSIEAFFWRVLCQRFGRHIDLWELSIASKKYYLARSTLYLGIECPANGGMEIYVGSRPHSSAGRIEREGWFPRSFYQNPSAFLAEVNKQRPIVNNPLRLSAPPCYPTAAPRVCLSRMTR